MVFSFNSTAAATLVLTSDGGGSIKKLEGYVNGTANSQYFLMLFDSLTVPANGVAPKRSLQVLGVDGFSFDYGLAPLDFGTGICFAVSSTEDTYTAVVDGCTVDWQGEWETVDVQGLSTSGDLTTPIDSRRPWTEAQSVNGTKAVYEVDWTNKDGEPVWLMLFATDIVANTRKPIMSWMTDSTSANVTLSLRFGDSGLVPQEMIAGVTRWGCLFAYSIQAGTMSQLTGAASTLRVKYK